MPRPPRNAPIWVKVFLAFHLFAITVWTFPSAPMDVKQGVREPKGFEKVSFWNDRHLRDSPLHYYTLGTGVWQYWDMFAPTPMYLDRWCTADITYADGSTRRYQYPRMYDMSILEKYPKERYRKFYERATEPPFQAMWKPFAERIAYSNFDNPNNPPVSVTLNRHFMEIAAPGQPQPTEYLIYPYFTYTVDPLRMERMKKEGL